MIGGIKELGQRIQAIVPLKIRTKISGDNGIEKLGQRNQTIGGIKELEQRNQTSGEVEILERRNLTINDIEKANELWSLAFPSDSEEFRTWFFTNEFPSLLNDSFWEKDKLQAVMYALKYPLKCRGKEFCAPLILGVATHPNARKKGYMRKLMQIAHEEYSQQYPAAALYPFDFGFYRKMGYGAVSERIRCVIRSDKLKNESINSINGAVGAVVDTPDLSALASINFEMSSRFGFHARRDEKLISRRLEDSRTDGAVVYQNSGAYAFVYTTQKQNNNPLVIPDNSARMIADSGAQMITDNSARMIADSGAKKIADAGAQTIADSGAQIITDNTARMITATELAYRDITSLRQLLAALARDYAGYDIEFSLPVCDAPHDWLADSRGSLMLEPYLMVRVLDMPSLIIGMQCENSADLTLRVLSETGDNTSCWDIVARNGVVSSASKSSRDADVTLTLEQAGRWICGRSDSDALGLEGVRNSEKLSFFPKLSSYFFDMY